MTSQIRVFLSDLKQYHSEINLPDKRTRSFKLSPWLAKLVCKRVKLKLGPGMLLLASVTFDIDPSLLPVGTFQVGPPFIMQK